MKWSSTSNVKGDLKFNHLCSEEKLKSMTQLLISNNYLPFALSKTNAVLQTLDTNKNPLDWSSTTIIWLNGYMFPSSLLNHTHHVH